MTDPESKPFVKIQCWIALHYRQRHCQRVLFCLIEEVFDDVRTDAFPLHRWKDVNGAEENRVALLSFLKPTHIRRVNGDDADLVGLKPPRKTGLLKSLVPTKVKLDRPSQVSKYRPRANSKSPSA